MPFRLKGKKVKCKFCDRNAMGRNLCRMHYYREYRAGTLNAHGKLTPDQLFEERIHKTDTCWLWTGTLTSRGYGSLILSGRKKESAHRFSYKKWVGPIPDNMVVMHKCDNPRCVNPEHLTIGTQADNLADCRAKKRHAYGTKNPMAKLNEAQIPLIRADPRPQSVIAKEYGVGQMTISCIKQGKRWKHVT